MLPSLPLRDIEIAFAHEAAQHAAAAAELNAFGEAEALELGSARAVYCGQWSPVHGVYGLGLDGPVEERDVREVEKFYRAKERPPAYWVSPFTDPSLLARIGPDFEPSKTVPVHGLALSEQIPALPEALGASQPNRDEWLLAFTRLLDPAAQAPGLVALTKLHQRETRFYLGAQNAASYTYFYGGIALAPYPSVHSLLALQIQEAREFRATFFAAGSECPLPRLFERTLYERI